MLVSCLGRLEGNINRQLRDEGAGGRMNDGLVDLSLVPYVHVESGVGCDRVATVNVKAGNSNKLALSFSTGQPAHVSCLYRLRT